ncbi:hypothetical protein JCM10212_006983 [Sporobolomyces blumeae]
MQAVVVQSPGKVAVQTVPKPQLALGQILVKNHAIALNPTDWKVGLRFHRDFVSPAGARLGCDFAGVVEQTSEDVTNVKIGDRVAGFVHGGRWEDRGSFAEYVATDSTLVWRVPESVSFEEAAASGGIAPLTAMQALYLRLRLELPSKPVKESVPVLIWGGTSSVGLYAVQLLKLSGYTVLATSSKKNWPLLRSLGVDSTYDYSEADVTAKIAADYPTLSLAVDCITENGTTFQCASSFAQKKGHVVALLPLDDKRLETLPDVRAETTLVYTVLGREFHWWQDWPVMEEDKRFTEDWLTSTMPDLRGSGKFKANPLLRRSGGLEAVNEGMDFQKAGKNHAEKLVYTLV